MTHLLLTRQHDDSEADAVWLQEEGFAVSVCPLMTIEFLDGAEATVQAMLGEVGGIVLTSRHGLRALAHMEHKDMPLYVVGESTAEAARAAGFTRITIASGNAASLAALLPKEMPLLYVRGQDVQHDIASFLPLMQEVITYSVPLRETLPQLPKIDAALLYSARAAHQFEALHPGGITIIAASPAIAATLHPERWRRILSSESPARADMLNVLKML